MRRRFLVLPTVKAITINSPARIAPAEKQTYEAIETDPFEEHDLSAARRGAALLIVEATLR